MMPPAIKVLYEVAAQYGIPVALLKRGPIRSNRELFAARSEAAKRLRNERGLSLNQIGRLLGGRHHTTILRMIDGDMHERTLARNRARDARLRAKRPPALRYWPSCEHRDARGRFVGMQ